MPAPLLPNALILAVPKGRILAEALPLLARAGIVPEAAFGDPDSRALRFATGDAALGLIRVRAFDVATFVAHGAAQLGIVGSDVLAEFDYPALYAPVDLGIGRCRLSVAMTAGEAPDEAGHVRVADNPGHVRVADNPGHVRVATKYPTLTARHYAQRGVQAECVKLNGAMELAPMLGLAPRIVDLVSSGRTLAENGLVEVERVADVSARLIVNRAAFKTRADVVALVDRFRAAVGEARGAVAEGMAA